MNTPMVSRSFSYRIQISSSCSGAAALVHSLSLAHSLSLILSRSLSLALSLSLSLSRSLALSLTLSLSHSLTLSHTHTHISVYPSVSDKQLLMTYVFFKVFPRIFCLFFNQTASRAILLSHLTFDHYMSAFSSSIDLCVYLHTVSSMSVCDVLYHYHSCTLHSVSSGPRL